MRFDPILAEIRFGCGLSPRLAPPSGVEHVLAGLTTPDDMAMRYPIESSDTFLARARQLKALQRSLRDAVGTAMEAGLRDEIRQQNISARQAMIGWLAVHMVRRVRSATPLRERLERFWADHFTAMGKSGVLRHAGAPYVETAIRPNIAGRFEDLLFAAVTHPLMVQYLDQDRSIGPGSALARQKQGAAGLNENLAREVLELHTLGVDGPYDQRDVTELAALFTGLSANIRRGTVFLKNRAEPGGKRVLGRDYGRRGASMRDIRLVLRDLARNPATARHVAGKLAVHFVSDQPDPALVTAIERAYLDSDGHLPACYRALLVHESAWDPAPGNVKQPFDLIASACRALDVPPGALIGRREGQIRSRIYAPLRLMGQLWQRPAGPDGWPEADSAWITPQGMAARLQWAMAVPRLLTSPLPDPRTFVDTALGGRASPALRFAASAAESRSDGVGLVLASPDFQRM